MSTATRPTFEVKNLGSPDERRTPSRGVLDIVNLPGATIVRATFEPGWRWSTDVAPVVGTESCLIAHTGVILSGRFHVSMNDGRDYDFGPGDAHVVAPGHDAWVVGEEAVVVYDFSATGSPAGGHLLRCPCGVEFRAATDDQLAHLVAAVREHASGSHGHELTDDQVLAEVSAG